MREGSESRASQANAAKKTKPSRQITSTDQHSTEAERIEAKCEDYQKPLIEAKCEEDQHGSFVQKKKKRGARRALNRRKVSRARDHSERGKSRGKSIRERRNGILLACRALHAQLNGQA